MLFVSAADAATLDRVRARGQLKCGVNTALAGFAMPDARDTWQGINVDVCRAVAAAIFGDAKKVRFVPVSNTERFAALQSGEMDILAQNTTFTFERDVTFDLRMVMVNFYDGQGFLVSKGSKARQLRDLAGGRICVQENSTHAANIEDWMRQYKIKFLIETVETTFSLIDALRTDRCDTISSDSAALAGMRAKAMGPPDDYIILPDRISKEPLGPMIKRDDDQWLDIVRWSMMAMLEAEEQGVTSANADRMLAESQNPSVQRLLGKTGDFGKQIGLDNAWAFNIIKQVGNYAESFDRNVGPGSPLKLDRGMNALWNKGGLMYPVPFR
jgi:general L-amino acid transport system substrate-binding protein